VYKKNIIADWYSKKKSAQIMHQDGEENKNETKSN
jgi:hypothetical protein